MMKADLCSGILLNVIYNSSYLYVCLQYMAVWLLSIDYLINQLIPQSSFLSVYLGDSWT